MQDLELPLGKRTRAYRAFEMLPGLLSYGMLIIMVVLSALSPFAAAIYLLLLIITMLYRALGIAAHSIAGHRRMVRAQKIDWQERLAQLEDPVVSYEATQGELLSKDSDFMTHRDNLRLITADPSSFPKPSSVYNLVIIAAYNEPYNVIAPTLKTLIDTTYDKSHIIVVFAYEERGGEAIRDTAKRLKKEFGSEFGGFYNIMHPENLPDEIIGKGPNITYAAEQIAPEIKQLGIPQENTIVTTLDCDNKPHKLYFDYLTYEFIVHENRKHLSFQPVALYFGNIWDAPAPMRVIATGNSFWTVVSSMRPHTLRNFAAHSQPLEALSEMGYWSKRSIVEDGHQYWRSYFYFSGNYDIVPIHVPIYQDAVYGETLKITLIAQFKQLRRWGYGASDVPYVAVRLFSRKRTIPFGAGLARFMRLVDSHVTLATVAILVALGGWVPLLVSLDPSQSIFAHNLPALVSYLQRTAMIGLFVTIFLSIRLLPPRPARYKRRRTIGMVAQWLLMPLTAIGYNAAASLNAQTHLLFGKYLDKFDVTEKSIRED